MPAPAAPITLSGVGQTATQSIKLPSSISIAYFTHSGSRNFIVKTFAAGKQDLLINEIGAYTGSRPLTGSDPITFDIQADGAWTLRIEAIPNASSANFSGKGDAVSGLFNPPAQGAWEIFHDGKSNFVVYLRCSGGNDLIQNEIGQVSGSRVVSFKKGPCYWEVEADGNWSLKAR